MMIAMITISRCLSQEASGVRSAADDAVLLVQKLHPNPLSLNPSCNQALMSEKVRNKVSNK